MRTTKHNGFTLVELLVSMSIVIIFSSYFLKDLGSVFDYKSRIETQNKLKAWQNGVGSVYLANSATIDNDVLAKLVLLDGTEILPTAVAANGRCAMAAASSLQFANRAGLSAGDIILDGYKQSFCLFITPRLTDTVNGTDLFYHSIAVVSPGGNGRIEATTSLDATGNLIIDPASDDTGVLFDGRKFSVERYNQTIASMNRAVEAYNAYYAARYQTDATRSLSTDYFSCGAAACPSATARWDTTGEMVATCTAPIPMVDATAASPHLVLGLSTVDVTDGWGTVFNIDNCTNAVRSPANTNVARSSPPYTASISATLPGGSVLSMTSVGAI